MLSALGGSVEVTDDGFILTGTRLHGGEIDGANDHRIVMSAAILAAATDGAVVIRGAQAVNKSYPTFFEDIQKLGGTCSVVTHG